MDHALIKRTIARITDKQRSHYTGDHPTRKFSTPEEEITEYAVTHSKTCKKCGEDKCLLHFALNTSGRDGFDQDGYRLRRPECQDCTKSANKGINVARKIAKEKGISYKAPEGSCCAICGATEKLVFDHDHQREVFRGYLCDPCNRSMGVLGDNIQGLLRCVNYLQRTEQQTIEVSADGIVVIKKE